MSVVAQGGKSSWCTFQLKQQVEETLLREIKISGGNIINIDTKNNMKIMSMVRSSRNALPQEAGPMGGKDCTIRGSRSNKLNLTSKTFCVIFGILKDIERLYF